MSLVDAARKLLQGRVSSDDYCQHCERCITFRLTGDNRDDEHAPDCPWLQMPQIVAALEAAERFTRAGIVDYCCSPGSKPPYVHLDSCEYGQLLTALAGES